MTLDRLEILATAAASDQGIDMVVVRASVLVKLIGWVRLLAAELNDLDGCSVQTRAVLDLLKEEL